jgi:diguanylate cyclase (GGDEF)-like protein
MMRKFSGKGIKSRRDSRSLSFSLPWMLMVPFVLQVVTVVGLVGYLSYRNGQRSVEDVTNQLLNSSSERVEEKLTSYLATPRLANQLNQDAILRGHLKLNLEQPDAQREQFLWQAMQLFNNLTWITIGTETGDSLGIWRPGENQPLQISTSNALTQYLGTYYGMNDQGERTAQLKVERPAYDPRVRPWYKEAIAARQPIWSSIYAGFTPGTVFIAASQPLYDTTGKLVGVSGTDLSLLSIQTFLAQNPVSPYGQTFLIERSGLLVASSSQELPFRKIADQPPQRVNVLASQTPLIQATAQALQQKFGKYTAIQQSQTFSFDFQQHPQFVQVLPYSQASGIDWLIVVVVPTSDVMGKINSSTQTTVWLCLAAVTAVIILNAFISRWLVKPVTELNQASQQIAQGNFHPLVQTSRIRELSALARSFTQMSQELYQSRRQLEGYSRSLEQTISDRTQALQQEIHQRQAAEAALQNANQELQRIAYLDGLTQIANRRQFDERLALEWRTMKRDRSPLSLILCDVDYFKQYNDAYGHQAGDDCLRHVATAIANAACRAADLPARYGGEEFAVLLPNTPLEGAIEVAKVIQTYIQYLEIPHRQSDVSLFVTASFGVISLIPTEEALSDELLIGADKALYQAKVEGRDRINAIHFPPSRFRSPG